MLGPRLALSFLAFASEAWAPFFGVKCSMIGIIPVQAATPQSIGPSSTGKSLAQKMFADTELPPVTLDLQLDFDVSFSPQKPKKKAPKSKKVTPKKTTPKPPPPKKAAPKALPKTVAFPPPPPQPKQLEVKPVTPPPTPPPPVKVKKSAPKKSFKTRFGGIQQRVSAANQRVSQHKYATVVWATLLFVWAPLSLIWAANKFMGKEFLIDIIVRLFPFAPATWIELAIEDGLWVGVFGVCVVATVGTTVIEATTLVMDFVRGMAPTSKNKARRKN